MNTFNQNSKKIVAISGGNGSGVTLNALKLMGGDIELSAVIAMSDSGGSTGRLRKEFGTLPVGDIMRAVLAMSPYDQKLLKKIFYRNRFEHVGKLDGHNIGNLFLVLSEQYGGDFMSSINALHQVVDAVGKVYPVTLEQSDLCVELTNGDIVIGEHEIDRPKYDRQHKIIRAWLQPTPALYGSAKQAIEEADCILLGPGSLYCSIIPSLLVEGMQEALRKSKAKLVYVLGNAYEKMGETGPESCCDFVQALETYLPRELDRVVYNNYALSAKEMDYYDKKGWSMIRINSDCSKKDKIISGDFERKTGGLDPAKLAKVLEESIACNK